jgi:hypothetical protein
LSTYIDRTTNVLRQNIAWLNEQWGDGNDNGNGNDDDDDNNEESNNEGQLCMYVWKDGQAIEYALLAVDSITFAKKEQLVVKAQVPSSWKNDIYVYTWGDEGENEVKTQKQGDWYVYAHDGKKLNVIFKNGRGWSGNQNQSEDIYTEKSACYIITLDAEGENKAKATQVDCP